MFPTQTRQLGNLTAMKIIYKCYTFWMGNQIHLKHISEGGFKVMRSSPDFNGR